MLGTGFGACEILENQPPAFPTGTKKAAYSDLFEMLCLKKYGGYT